MRSLNRGRNVLDDVKINTVDSIEKWKFGSYSVGGMTSRNFGSQVRLNSTLLLYEYFTELE